MEGKSLILIRFFYDQKGRVNLYKQFGKYVPNSKWVQRMGHEGGNCLTVDTTFMEISFAFAGNFHEPIKSFHFD